MEELEKQIEEAANLLVEDEYGFLEYIRKTNLKESFVDFAKSEAAKQYHLLNSRHELRMLFNLGIDFARHHENQSFDIDSSKREMGLKYAMDNISQMISYNKKIGEFKTNEQNLQQGTYSEEEVLNLLRDAIEFGYNTCYDKKGIGDVMINQWIGQNKKK